MYHRNGTLHLHPAVLALATCWSVLIFGGVALAQGVLAPPPLDFSGLPPGLQTTGTNQPGTLETLFAAPAATASKPPFELGPVQFRPHLLYRFLYGDGIPAAPGQHLKTAINEIYPGILLTIGNHWYLDYTPTLRYYSNNHFADTLDHNVILNGAFNSGSWNLGFSQSYVSSSQPLIETGTTTRQETYTTVLDATYHFNSKMSLELGANQTFVFLSEALPGQALSDSATWSTLDWLNYDFTPKFSGAIGLGYGYVDMRLGPDMMFEQVQGRVSWHPGQKLTLILTGGGEIRQFLSGGASDLVNPLYGFSVEYHVFESTTLLASGHRVVSPSYFENQITETSDVSGGLRQRLFERLILELSGGYYESTYTATVSGLPVNRKDHGTFFTARLSVPVLKRGTVAALYQFSDNSSNESAFDFTSNQVGFEVGYRF
jgi:hypothetical protein